MGPLYRGVRRAGFAVECVSVGEGGRERGGELGPLRAGNVGKKNCKVCCKECRAESRSDADVREML